MPTYAIGDVQGCFESLLALLEMINYRQAQDTLWLTGDLVNRGPHSLEVLRFLKHLPEKNVYVLGNHDLHLLAVAENIVPLTKSDTLGAILAAHDRRELLDWLRHLPLLHHSSKLNFTMVHAGLPPQWDLKLAQSCAQEVETVLRGTLYKKFLTHMYGDRPNYWRNSLTGWKRLRFITNCLTRIRFCDSMGVMDLDTKGSIGTQPQGFMPWFQVPERTNKNLNILFGHWAALEGVCQEPTVYPLDGGCVWGGCLIAMRLEDRKLFKVPCRI